MKKLLIHLLELLLERRVLPPKDLPRDSVKRILVIRQHDQLGDFLLATPVFRALKNRFPGAKVGLLARGYFAEVIRHHPDVDEVLVWKPSGGWSLSRILAFRKQLRSGWDLAVVLNTVSHSVTSDVLSWLCGAPFVLGPEGREFSGTRRNFLYNLLAPLAQGPRHQTDRNLDIVRFIGADSSILSPSMRILEEEKTEAVRHLQKAGWDPYRPSLGFHLGAGKIGNRWPLARFADLGKSLHEKGVQVVVTWGLGEETLGEAFRGLAGFKAVYAGAPAIRLLAACFTRQKALVVNDTGMLHLAAAAGVPLVAVFGPTDPADWKPIGEKFLAAWGAEGRPENVSVDEVEGLLKKLL